jgi:hypothetical protein
MEHSAQQVETNIRHWTELASNKWCGITWEQIWIFITDIKSVLQFLLYWLYITVYRGGHYGLNRKFTTFIVWNIRNSTSRRILRLESHYIQYYKENTSQQLQTNIMPWMVIVIINAIWNVRHGVSGWILRFGYISCVSPSLVTLQITFLATYITAGIEEYWALNEMGTFSLIK